MDCGLSPCGTNSAYSSIALAPSRWNASLIGMLLAEAPAPSSLVRIASHALSTAEQVLAVAHLARPCHAGLPAERLGRLVVAGHERAARIRLAVDRILHRVVDAAQLDRVHPELPGELVHRALERVDVRHDRRRAHVARR